MAKKVAVGKMVRVAEGVYKRNGAYLVAVWDGVAKRKVWHGSNCDSSCGHDQIVDLASAKLARLQLTERKRRNVGRAEETVGEWAERWLVVFPRRTESTMAHNRERVQAFVDGDVVSRTGRVVVREGGFRDRPLRSLREDELWEWAREHLSSVKEVRAMLNDAIKLKLLEENPLQHFALAERRGRQDIQTLAVSELDLLLDCAHEVHGDFGPSMAAMIETAAFTGVRPGELFMFSRQAPSEDWPKVNVIDFRAGSIRVDWQWNVKAKDVTDPKWGSKRVVVLLPRAETALRSLPELGPGPVFRTKRGQPYTGRSHHYYWEPVRRLFVERLPRDHWLRLRMAAARLEGKDDDLDFYELRHFFGTSLAHPPAGIRPASPYEIMQQMGHKDLKVTMRYLHSEGVGVSASLRDAWRDQAPRRRRAS